MMVENAVASNGGFLVLSVQESGLENDSVTQNSRLLAVNVNSGETTPLPLTNHYSATTVPVPVLDAHGPKLLVFADISQTVDKAKNALYLRRRMGLIDRQDYLNGTR